jgi:GNAT superfamily N-acetyltransferase
VRYPLLAHLKAEGSAPASAPGGRGVGLTGLRRGSADIEVRPISSAADRTAFLALPYKVQGSDPNWIAPLRFERRQHIDPRHNPWFEHAEASFFLAWRGGRPVGRISAQIDRLARERSSDNHAQFGMLEAQGGDLAVISALLNAAEQFARTRGARILRGPFSLSINDECGLLIEGFDTAPAMMMGHAPPEYGRAIDKFGYVKAKDLVTYELSVVGAVPPIVERTLKRSNQRGMVAVRPVQMNRFLDEVRILVDIFNDAWSDNWGFVPFTEAEVSHLASSLKLLIRPELVLFAEVDGEPVGVFAAVPDLNEAIRGFNGRLLPLNWIRLLWRLKAGRIRRFRVPLVGVRRRHQGGFTSAEVIYRMWTQARDALQSQGFNGGELGWILEDNLAMRRLIEFGGGQLRKIDRIYEKDLGDPAKKHEG